MEGLLLDGIATQTWGTGNVCFLEFNICELEMFGS